jgi:hypothetical protein
MLGCIRAAGRPGTPHGKGRPFLRVWSTDWFDNSDLQTDRLVRQIEELRARPVAPYEDYIITPVYTPGEAEPSDQDQTIFCDPPPCSAEHDGSNGAVNNIRGAPLGAAAMAGNGSREWTCRT